MTFNSEKITSRSNERLKALREVRDGRVRELVFVEGHRLVLDAFSSGQKFRTCAVSSEFLARAEQDTDLNDLFRGGTDLLEVPSALFKAIAETPSPQGILAVIERPQVRVEDIEADLANSTTTLPIVVFLYQINNPANLGAVVRTAEAAGTVGVITSEGSADAFSPAALRGSMGSAFRIPIWERVRPDEVIKWARDTGLATIGAAGGSPVDHMSVDWKKPALVVFGSEAHGIPRELSAELDGHFEIKMNNPVESLNLAVSCGITLFEARRQNLTVIRDQG